MKRKQNFSRFISVCLTLFLFVAIILSGRSVSSAFATTVGSANVLEELQTDYTFDINDYPVVENDYKIYVIQVAENKSGVLYLYTYQPCQYTHPLVATQINMSLTDKLGCEVTDEITDKDKPKLYGLTLINSTDVFCKYKVNNFAVNNDDVRYYNIVSIYRAWDKIIDKDSGNNNTVNEVSFPVGNVYCVSTENGELHYSLLPRYVVNILDPYSDFLFYAKNTPNYAPSLNFYNKIQLNSFDAHYIAFSTDWDIDYLLSADVHYYYKSASGKAKEWFGLFGYNDGMSYGKENSKTVTIEYDQKFDASYTGLFDHKRTYSWDRIQSVDEFLSTEKNLTGETKSNLQGKQWVLRFAETDRIQTEVEWAWGVCTEYQVDWTIVDRVTVLRLEFETNGVVYNLGAVSDVVSGDEFAGNVSKKLGFWAYIWQCLKKFFNGTANVKETIIAVFVLLVCILILPLTIVVLGVIFPPFGRVLLTILKAIGKGLLWLLKGLWWLICLPFRGIKALINKIRGDGGE